MTEEKRQTYPPPQYYYPPQQQQQQQYGTFQGSPGYAAGYPTPARPQYTEQPATYHSVPVYPVLEPSSEDLPPLPCCGIGIGWFLFILGFFIASVPWYAGAIILICTRPDPRERVGLICCTIAAILSLIAAIVGGTTAMS